MLIIGIERGRYMRERYGEGEIKQKESAVLNWRVGMRLQHSLEIGEFNRLRQVIVHSGL